MRRLILFLLVLVPAPALAIDMDFHTYNGFDETVAMFTRLALIFSDAGFRTYFTIFALVGILVAIMSTALMGSITGTGSNPASGLVPIIIGAAIVRGLVFPTGNIVVFDPVRNATATVPRVPDLIVLLAGGMNSLERGLVSIFETAGAHPYGNMRSSVSYALIRAAHRGNLNDYYLERSLANYYLDCGIPALGQGTTGRRQNLRNNTTDLMDDFEQWQNVALFTTYHPAGDDGGDLRSCTDAWTALEARLTAPTTFDDYTASVCETAGFNPTETTQLAQCRTALGRATGLFGIPSQTSGVPLLRAMVMAKSVSNALNSADFSQAQRTLINRQVIAEGFGTSQAMDQWIPKVRVFLTVLALGCVPVVVLFLVTPAYQAAMVLLMGLFSWLAMWGACDAMAVQMAQDAALDAFAQIQRQRLGIDAILESPEAAVQALGVFGKARMVAITLATVLSGALFKFGGYAFARLGEQWQSHLEQSGEQAGRQTMLPEETAQFQRSLVGAAAFQGSMSQVGFDHMAGGQALGEMQPGQTSSYISNELSMSGGQYSAMQAQRDVFETEKHNSYRQIMAERGVSPDDAGRADGSFGSAQVKATNYAGPKAIEDSEMVKRGQETGIAKVANQVSNGQPFNHGLNLGVRQSAIGAAELHRDQAIAGALGLNPNDIGDSVQYQRMSNSQVQLALSPDAVKRIADNPNVDLSPDQREYMKANPNAGYAMTFNQNPDGNWTAGSIRTGTDISAGNFSQFRDGRVSEQRNDSTISNLRNYDASENMGGANRLLEKGHTENLIQRAFNIDGSVNPSSLAAFGKGFGEALSDRGFTLSRQHADELRDHSNLSRSVDGGISGNVGFELFGVDFSGRLGGGIRQSWDDSKGWSKSDSVHENRNLLLMQSLGAGAMEQAKTEYLNQHGTLPPSGSSGSDQIYARASELFRNDFNSLVSDSQARLEKPPDELDKSEPEQATFRPTSSGGRNNPKPVRDKSESTWRPGSARW